MFSKPTIARQQLIATANLVGRKPLTSRPSCFLTSSGVQELMARQKKGRCRILRYSVQPKGWPDRAGQTTRGNVLLVDLEVSTKRISKPGDELELGLINIQLLVVKCPRHLPFITRIMNAMKTNFLCWKIVLELVPDVASWIRVSYRFDHPGYLFLSSAGEK